MVRNTSENGAPPPTEQHLATGLLEANNAGELDGFLQTHADLLEPSLVEDLCRRAAEATTADPARGAKVAAAARVLAERLDDDRLIGLALRAQANALLYQRDYQGAQARYEQALERLEAAGDETGAAVTRSIGLGCLCHLGDYETALEWAAKARAILERSGDPLLLARLDQNVALVYSRTDRFDQALERLRSAHQAFSELGEVRHAGVALRNMAVCYQDLNDFEASLRTYEDAREYCRAHGLTVQALEVEYNIAYLFYLRGEYAKAIRLFEEARLSCEKEGDKHHAALCDLDQAEIYLELNLVDEAAHLAAAARKGFESLGMTYEVAKAVAFEGLAAGRLGNLEKAIEHLDRAHEIFVGHENLVWQGVISLHRARLLQGVGALEKATDLARKAHAAFSRASVPSRTALSEILLAKLAVESGDSEEAQRMSAEALARASSLGMPEVEYQAHLVAGQVEEAANRRHRALAAYRLSLEALEALRGGLAGEDLKIAFSRGKEALFSALVRLTLDGGSSDEASSEAFGYVERAKSRSLTDLLAGSATGLEPRVDVDPKLAATVRELSDELKWTYGRIKREELEGGERAKRRIAELGGEAHALEERLQRAQRRLEALDPELAAAQSTEVVDLESLTSVLPPDAMLIEYYETPDGLYVFLVGQDGIEVRTLPVIENLPSILKSLSFQLSRHSMGLGRILKRDDTNLYLHKLYDALIAPLRRELRCRRLVVVPHGPLHRVPFSALYDGERYLLDDYEVSYAPSATVLYLSAIRELRSEPCQLVMGVPDRLAPQILDEAKAVADILPNARLLVGEEATRSRLARMGERCRVVHLATHGHFRRDNPMFSAIQLSDSRLSLFDLYALRLNADLVVLSGCGTGLGEVWGGDELIGLTRGILYAGSRAVLATLWDVHDESTREFMVSFYNHLEAEPQPAAALRAAQLELRERFTQPYHWAPFLLVGATHGPSGVRDRAPEEGATP